MAPSTPARWTAALVSAVTIGTISIAVVVLWVGGGLDSTVGVAVLLLAVLVILAGFSLAALTET
jgi:hypothetical protein